MKLSSCFKPLARLALAIGESARARRAVRLLMKPFALKSDVCVHAGDARIYVASLDRLAAALLWKYSLLGGCEEKLYRERVRPGMTVLEIGANVGFFTLLFSRLAGPGGRVIAFEPDADNFRLLVKNLKANGAANVTCVHKAVAEKDGKARLFFSEEHRGDHRIYDSGDGRPAVEIETAALDSFLPADTRVDFIKMDIQGAEYAALLGMERTLRRQPQLAMLCEFSPSLLRRAGADPERFLAGLAGTGFSIKLLDEENGSAAHATAAELLAACPGECYVNLLLEKGPR